MHLLHLVFLSLTENPWAKIVSIRSLYRQPENVDTFHSDFVLSASHSKLSNIYILLGYVRPCVIASARSCLSAFGPSPGQAKLSGLSSLQKHLSTISSTFVDNEMLMVVMRRCLPSFSWLHIGKQSNLTRWVFVVLIRRATAVYLNNRLLSMLLAITRLSLFPSDEDIEHERKEGDILVFCCHPPNPCYRSFELRWISSDRWTSSSKSSSVS